MPRIVTFGEIMLRLSPPGHKRFSQASNFEVIYGGGESNVAVTLANYGLDARFVTRLPKNDIGDCALMTLRAHNVDTSHVVRGGERLGIYFLETGAMQRGSKVVYDRAHSGMATIEPGEIDWDSVFEGVDWFHWTGITPALSQTAADACLEACKAASAKGITISTDLNYRKKLWNYGKSPQEVMPALVEYCDIILGNEEDAEKHFDIHPESVDVTKGDTMDPAAYLPVCKALMKRFPKAKKVITTLRGSISASHNTWSGVMWDGENMYTAPTYQLSHIVDRVGGGDSFMGGLIYALLNWPEDDATALRFAVAASALKHSIFGDANLATVEEVMAQHCRANYPDLALGVGSVVDAPTAALYIQLGADFIVSPMLVEEIAPICNRRKIGWMPGCFTPSEIGRAETLGAEIVKCFPGNAIAPGFIKSVLAPSPRTSIMVTGGVAPNKESLGRWFGEGAIAVGMGSGLLRKDLLAAGDYKGIEALAAKCLKLVAEAKG